jgi:hypothetical protein
MSQTELQARASSACRHPSSSALHSLLLRPRGPRLHLRRLMRGADRANCNCSHHARARLGVSRGDMLSLVKLGVSMCTCWPVRVACQPLPIIVFMEDTALAKARGHLLPTLDHERIVSEPIQASICCHNAAFSPISPLPHEILARIFSSLSHSADYQALKCATHVWSLA